MNCRYGTPHGFLYPFMGPLAALHPIEPTGRVRVPTPLTSDSSMRVEDPLYSATFLRTAAAFAPQSYMAIAPPSTWISDPVM